MLQDQTGSLFLTLSSVLVGNTVQPQAVRNALRLLSDSFHYDGGMVYETDLSGSFLLTEQVLSDSDLAVPKLSKQEPLGKGIIRIAEYEGNSARERRLLDIFRAKELLLAPVADGGNHPYGLVVLLNTQEIPHRDPSDTPALDALLSLLTRYLGMRMYQRKITQSQAILEDILDNTGIDIYVNDFYSHDILYTNRSMAAPYGGKDEFVGKKCWQVLFPGKTAPCDFCPQKELVDGHGVPTKIYSWDYQRPFDGRWFRVFSTAFQWVDGRLAHVVSSADITENKKNEALIENLANYDQLTKLPNRRMLLRECESRINQASSDERGYLLFFDIDGFKSINDSFGHDAGDEFLIQLGEFFSGIPLLRDGIYRNGGDEFIGLIDGDHIAKDSIRTLSGFIHDRFQRPWKLKRGEAVCNVSIGVACYPEDGVTAEALVQRADQAMYQVKKTGGGGLCFGFELPPKQAGASTISE